jgi:hypothetical protein
MIIIYLSGLYLQDGLFVSTPQPNLIKSAYPLFEARSEAAERKTKQSGQADLMRLPPTYAFLYSMLFAIWRTVNHMQLEGA